MYFDEGDSVGRYDGPHDDTLTNGNENYVASRRDTSNQVDGYWNGAWANDVDYQTVFSRQVEALGKPGDVLIAISTSGNSPNILAAIQTARDLFLDTIVFTGKDGGKMGAAANAVIRIPSDDTQRIQEGHILTGHILCDLVEQAIID